MSEKTKYHKMSILILIQSSNTIKALTKFLFYFWNITNYSADYLEK